MFSRAKDDIVVKDPQKPIATSKEYFWSRFQLIKRMEKIPKIKLPIIFTNSTLEPTTPQIKGKEVILYLM